MVNKTIHLLELEQDKLSAIHRFTGKSSAIPLLLLHGSIENARIFYSKSGKGLAPYLAAEGFDVFAPDLLGKGSSTPNVSKRLYHSQVQVINRDIPAYIEFIRKYHPKEPIRFGAHSWGGVMLLGWYARFGNISDIGPMAFFRYKKKNWRFWN